jgi:predicted O-methyltransferase YrrM
MPYQNPDIESSYRANDLGKTLYDLVIKYKPKKVIEYGTLNGYSAVAIAMALEENGQGKLYSYDLWGKYEYKHTSMDVAWKNVKKYGLSHRVVLQYGDFWRMRPQKCDMVHFDLSNDGLKVQKAISKLKEISPVIVFEGGSIERDNVEWMKTYKRLPINDCGVKYKALNPLFPSISQYEKE